MQQLKETLWRFVDEGQVAGINVLVKKDGIDLCYEQAGFANLEEKKPFHRDTILRMYSMTKPITAAAVMLLMDGGYLSLGQQVAEILPAFTNLQVWENGALIPATRPMYIKDLLSMTSGLCYGGEMGNMASEDVQKVFDELDARLYTADAMTTEELVNRLGKCGLCFQPGMGWKYGTSADVLGSVIEKVSGMRFGDFLQEKFFQPLEMLDTGFFVPENKRDRMATAYEKKDKLQKFETNHLGIRYFQDERPAFESGGAGLFSTLDDYSKFAQMLLEQGIYEGKRIMSKESVAFFTHPKMMPWQKEYMWHTWDSNAGFDYGNLVRRCTEPQMAYFQAYPDEYGWDGWLGTYFANVPDKNMTILMGMQQKDAGALPIHMMIRNIVKKL